MAARLHASGRCRSDGLYHPRPQQVEAGGQGGSEEDKQELQRRRSLPVWDTAADTTEFQTTFIQLYEQQRNAGANQKSVLEEAAVNYCAQLPFKQEQICQMRETK